MNANGIFFAIKNCSRLTCILVAFFSLLFLVFFVFSVPHNVYGIESFSKYEKPFGISYDDWVSKHWNKWISMNTHEATPIPYRCLIASNPNTQSKQLCKLMDKPV